MSDRRARVNWQDLADHVGPRLIETSPPLRSCVADPGSPACGAALSALRNPFAIEDDPSAFHTTGWHGAFDSTASRHVVAAETTADIAAAVNFSRDHGLRLVIKGTGHDYLGRSCAPDSLTIWTHAMREVTVHDHFLPRGAPDTEGAGVPAITVGAGTRWIEAYQAAAAHDRFVSGGGCTTVGAAGGFTQGGGFGSFSRSFGTAAGNVLEMEVVTSNGDVVLVNAWQNADLFWALRGGGGGTFGVVSRVTFRTHEPPETLGAAAGSISASNDRNYRRLIERLVELFPALDNRHWGEQIRFGEDNRLELLLTAVDLTDGNVQSVWRPFLAWLDREPGSFSSEMLITAGEFPAFWDVDVWDFIAPTFIHRDERAGPRSGVFWWDSNQGEVSQYIEAYQSRWLPVRLFTESPRSLSDALFEASRHGSFGIHVNKGLSGEAVGARARDQAGSIHPGVFDAAGLLIMASHQQYVYPGIPGFEPDSDLGRTCADRVDQGMRFIREITENAGAYVNEADYFEPDWQRSFWGDNYPRLLDIKRRHDPMNLFQVHHGVGSETP